MMRNFWIQSLQESCKGNRIQRAIVDGLIATLSHNALNPMVFVSSFFLFIRNGNALIGIGIIYTFFA